MPNVHLRELLEAGFCGGYLAQDQQLRIGTVHTALDTCIREHMDELELLGSENRQTSLANKFVIPYAHQKYFKDCLTGISERFPACVAEELVSESGVAFTVFHDKDTLTYIEPAYGFVSKEYHVPMYAIICAYFTQKAGTSVNIRTISAMSDFSAVEKYPILQQPIKDLLDSATKVDMRIPGPQCQSCKLTACNFNVDLHTLVYAWMKQKQKFDDYKNQLREFLVMNGPTKTGAHLVYLKESVRRELKKGKAAELKGILSERLTVAEVDDCYKPDIQAIMKLIDKGKLPATVASLFSQSSSHSIDTGLSV